MRAAKPDRPGQGAWAKTLITVFNWRMVTLFSGGIRPAPELPHLDPKYQPPSKLTIAALKEAWETRPLLGTPDFAENQAEAFGTAHPKRRHRQSF